MKKSKTTFSVPVLVSQLLIVAAMLVTGLILFDSLPDQLPSHWNIAGEVDAYVDKGLGIYLFPGITLAIALLFPILSSIDPRKKKYKAFQRPWHILQMAIVLFFAYIYFVTLYLAFHPEVSIVQFIFAGMGILFIVIGNYLGKVRQNYFVGIKTPWTLDNEEVWNKTQRVGGWSFLIAGLIILINGFVQWQLVASMIVAVSIAAILPIVYSYVLHKRLKG
jgi:immunity protein, SdpI family